MADLGKSGSRCTTFSEYTLYGIYVENVLGYEAAGHYRDFQIYELDSWQAQKQSVDSLVRLQNTALASHHIVVMVSVKGDIPTNRIEQVFGLRSPCWLES